MTRILIINITCSIRFFLFFSPNDDEKNGDLVMNKSKLLTLNIDLKYSSRFNIC